MTVGDNVDPLLNPTILSSSTWATEVKVDTWGQFVAIIRTTGAKPLVLRYVAVFASLYDCKKIILPTRIQVGSRQSYPIVDLLCNPIITAVVLQGPSSLPGFMVFDAITKTLTVTPAVSDID